MSGGRDEPVLGRWSRLKRQAREAPREEPPPPETEERDETAPPALAGEENPAAALPDIDTLDKESDYTVFLKDGVPEALRNRALRKLWRSDPVLANLDGLNDYDEDFIAEMKEGVAWMQKMAEEEARRLTKRPVDDAPGAEAEGDDVADGADGVDDGAGDGALPEKDGSGSAA